MPDLEISPLAGSIGAEIRGVDLGAPIDDDTFRAIHGAFLEHHVVFLPKQSLDPGDQVAFGRRFGELTPAHPILPPLDGHPEVLVLDSTEGGKANEWHTDVTFVERPPLGSILHALWSQSAAATRSGPVWKRRTEVCPTLFSGCATVS